MPHSSVKWRLACLASFSMILSVTLAASDREVKHPRVFNKNLKESLKTESENVHGHSRSVGDDQAKTIDYTLYNYGGNTVLSLSKSHHLLNYTDTQATTLAALGNAALVIGGAMLFGQLNNRIQARTQHELYARGFRGNNRPGPMPLRKRRLRNRFRKRRLPTRGYSQRNGRPRIGGRRRLRKNFSLRKRPIFQHTRKVPVYNQRIEEYQPPQTRDQISVPLRDESYNVQPTVLDPIKPMMYDPYSMVENRQEHLMDDYDYNSYNYDDYYDDMPDYSALKGGKPEKEESNFINTQGRSLTPAEQPLVPPPVEENQIETRIPARLPPPTRMPTRNPARNEMLLKMSEEKRLENLQKERAKLLEATIMKPETTKKPEKERTRIRIPVKRRRKPEELENEIKMEPPAMFNRPPVTAFQTSFEPEEVTFQRPEGYRRPETLPYNRPGRNPEVAKTGEETEDPFYFRAEMGDPFQEIGSDFDVNNEDWISTISEAFEGFSDFKKLKK